MENKNPENSISNILSFPKTTEQKISSSSNYSDIDFDLIKLPKVVRTSEQYTEEDTTTSDLIVGEDGVIREHWDIIENVYGRIVEISKTKATIEYFANENNKAIKERVFPINFVEGNTPLIIGQFIIIQFRVKKGKKVVYEFVNGAGIIPNDYFASNDPFDALENISLGKIK